MAETPFDTLGMMRQLEAKGFSPEQAEGVTLAVQTGVTGGVATKADVAELRTDLKWVKLIGGGILAVLVWPLLRDLLMTLNGTTP